jgi:hypothetical protein
MDSLKQIRSRATTVIAAAVIKQFRKAGIIESVIKSAKANNLVATGQLINPEVSGSIIPYADDRWLTPRANTKKIVSVRIYGTRMSDGSQFPSSIKIKIDLGDYGLSNKYAALATSSPERFEDGSLSRDSGDMIDRVESWIEDKMDRGYSFYYIDNKKNERPLVQGDRVNRTRAAYAIMRKLSEKGPEKVNFASAFNKVGSVLEKSSLKIQEATYFEVISPALRKTIETIF